MAESIGELIAEHQSISRNLAQVPVDPMSIDELKELIEKGFARAEMDFEDGLDQRIAELS